MHMPGQDRLGRGDAVFGGDVNDDWIGKQIAAAPERAPRFGNDAVLAVVGQLFDLGKVRMQFDLVERR